jgi:hypothetical protein
MTPALPPGGLCPRWRALCRDLFVHETESELILNGSRDVSFTLDLVKKDIGLFHKNAKAVNVPLEISPLQVSILDRQLASDDVPRPSFEAANPISEHHAKGLQQALDLVLQLDGACRPGPHAPSAAWPTRVCWRIPIRASGNADPNGRDT